MKLIKKLTAAFAVVFITTQFSCNKPDAASIIVGEYTYSYATKFIKYNYKIVADTLQLSNPQQTFFSPPFPAVEITKNTIQQVTFKQNVPNETVTFNKVNLFLDAGGTLLKGEVENNKFIDGRFAGYVFYYDIYDTLNKQVTRVSGIDTKR